MIVKPEDCHCIQNFVRYHQHCLPLSFHTSYSGVIIARFFFIRSILLADFGSFYFFFHSMLIVKLLKHRNKPTPKKQEQEKLLDLSLLSNRLKREKKVSVWEWEKMRENFLRLFF